MGRGARWTLTPAAFDALLECLDVDRVRAGERYELIRRKLVKFFEWRGALGAEDLADETLNRVARRVSEGERVRDVSGYAAGVARMVWREAAKQQDRVREFDDATAATPVERDDDETISARANCLDECLATLPDDHRALVLAYFADEKRAKIDHRRELATGLGIEINALRIRVHRIRGRLESCVHSCVDRPARR